MKLIATFDLELSHNFLVNGSIEDIKLKLDIDDYQAEVTLVPYDKGPSLHPSEDQYPTYCVSTLIISISGIEDTPPPVLIKEDGSRNDIEFVKYFDDKLPNYQNIAGTLAARLIRFFKYTLCNPLLIERDIDMSGINNPVWTNESGKKFEPVRRCFIGESIPGLQSGYKFGTRPLNISELDELTDALKSDTRPELFQELLSDAQAAIYQDNLRRALLELAIASEIAVKQTFFAKTTPAGAAYEYLEDTRRVNISVLELIHGAAKQAFGSSFKDTNDLDYKNIDYLFRCRNKIAHRGEIIYKDDSGNYQNVTKTTIEQWWKSVENLISWLTTFQT
ncbi:MAG TPA: hypothetical protein ENH23_08185 [candidate division Zixibacteria bacterium]|nr:hypothetical protein [candidate division Zixibacteria bacterium]